MWTNEQRTEFAKNLILTAKLYGYDMGLDLARMFVDDLQDLPYSGCNEALVTYRRDVKNKTWPRVSEIRAILQPVVDDSSVAIELANQIMKCIGRFGYNWADGTYTPDGNVYSNSKGQTFNVFKDCLVSELGEIGWSVVQKRGGWRLICEQANEADATTYKAQLRDHVRSVMSFSKTGTEVENLSLPTPANNQVRGLLEIMNRGQNV